MRLTDLKAKYIILFILFFVSGTIFAQKNIVLLSTNDTHSRIEPLPATDNTYPDKGGAVRRAAYIDKERKENKNVLVFDAGDFVQGTPYFNMFGGRVETKVMNLIGYDAGTLGNHEFDDGLDTLKRIVSELNFPIVICNYDFSNTVLKGLVKPYIILKKDGLKIGVLGVGADPDGLVQKEKYEGMIFNPIIESVNKYAKILKEQERCDLIICLSHIGYTVHVDGDIVDPVLAEQSRYVDIIIGGHSHTFMEKPDVRKNLDGKDILIFQTGKNGVYVDKIDVKLDKVKK